jgi:hypothetical protein
VVEGDEGKEDSDSTLENWFRVFGWQNEVIDFQADFESLGGVGVA